MSRRGPGQSSGVREDNEILLRTTGDARQHGCGRRANSRMVPSLPTSGRARSGGNGRALRRRHLRSRLAQAPNLLAVRREGGRLRADRRAAVRAAAIGTYRHQPSSAVASGTNHTLGARFGGRLATPSGHSA